MAAPIAPAPRLKRPTFKDPRLLIGVLLVLASIAGVVAVMGAANQTVAMLAPSSDIGAGESIDAGKLHQVKVSLGSLQGGYLSGGDQLASGSVALHALAKDQLIPKTSVGTGSDLKQRKVALKLDSPLPGGARKGDSVDVWVSASSASVVADTKGTPGEQAKKVADNAQVSDVGAQAQGLTSLGSTTIFILVDEDEVPAIVNAQANKSQISVVWHSAGKQ